MDFNKQFHIDLPMILCYQHLPLEQGRNANAFPFIRGCFS